jgi:LCP family protein required for cell wall assembly
VARRKRRAAARPTSADAGPSRLSLLILGLIGLSLALGAFGFYFQSQTQELAQTVFGTDTLFDLPTAAAPPVTPQAFMPPEESEDFNLLKQPTVPAAVVTPLPIGSGRIDRTLNVLLLGSDKRPQDPVWRTDVIMVVLIDQANGRAAILSLPRDLYVNIPTRGWDRINIADFWGEYTKYPGGGPGLLSRVIADNFGLRVTKYARVNFEGFQQIVDTVGGIDVNVPCALNDDFVDATSPTGYRHFQVEAGPQHMDGATALMFVRQRHGSGDISRTQRQQRVIFALREKLLSPGIVPKIPLLYAQLQNVIETNFGTLDLPGLVQIGTLVKPGNIRGRTLDETMWNFWMTPDGKSVLVFDKNKVRAAVEDLFSAPPIQDTKVVCY